MALECLGHLDSNSADSSDSESHIRLGSWTLMIEHHRYKMLSMSAPGVSEPTP